MNSDRLNYLLPIIKGVGTYLPGIRRLFPRKGTGGTDQALYCYGVWLKHLTLLCASSRTNSVPSRVAEIGPGDSLGVGIAALLCGATHYHALDVVRYSDANRTLPILDELVELFRAKAPRPIKGWPDFDDHLDGYLFPSHILSEKIQEESLSEGRIDAIRYAIQNPERPADGIMVEYSVPWHDSSVIKSNCLDLIISHSVLEHVVDLAQAYRAMSIWAHSGGYISHQIDFGSHNICRPWNGYRVYEKYTWKVITVKRLFLINREVPSRHAELIQINNFKIINEMTLPDMSGISRERLASHYKSISDFDLFTRSMFIQAQKIN